jgi:hypothetical protein
MGRAYSGHLHLGSALVYISIDWRASVAKSRGAVKLGSELNVDSEEAFSCSCLPSCYKRLAGRIPRCIRRVNTSGIITEMWMCE